MTKTNDRTLQALAALAREKESAIAAGAEAAATDPAAAVVLAPFDAGEREALHGAVLARLRGAAGTGTRPAEPAAPAVDELAKRRLRRRYLSGVVGVALAVAAAVVLIPTPPLLPEYAATVRGGLAGDRAAPAVVGAGELPTEASPLRLRPDGDSELVLVPAQRPATPLHAHVFVRIGAELREARCTPEVSPTGAVRLLARAGELFPGHTGRAALIVVLGAGGAGVDEDARRAASADRLARGWRRTVLPVEIVAAP